MKNNTNLYLMMQEDDHDISMQVQGKQASYIKQNSRYTQQNSHFTSYTGNRSNTKQPRTQSKRNQNQQLQDLLQTQTVNYGNLSQLSGQQKKRLFPSSDMSFFSKDCTQDHSNYEGYAELMNKIHFERSRNRELNHELTDIKDSFIKKYLGELMEEFEELSQENKRLRQVYKKEAGGGYRQRVEKNASSKVDEAILSDFAANGKNRTEVPTPRNSVKTGRKSVKNNEAPCSVIGSEKPFTSTKYNSSKPTQNTMKDKKFFGLGSQNFCQTQKMQTMLRQANKQMHYCQSSININTGQSLVPSPKRHKRRQSQLTERKDYPGNKENMGNDFLMILDDGSEVSFDNSEVMTGRMSQPGKMPKQRYAKDVDDQAMLRDSGHWENGMTNNKASRNPQGNFNDTAQRKSLQLSLNEAQYQHQSQPTSNKNIFLQFLQTLLIEQRATYSQMAQEITQTTVQAQQTFHVPSYNSNIKPIEKLQKEIMNKNLKLRQLQEVINVFKCEIEQIMGTDIKMVDQLMNELLEVKGKYLEMQEKVNGMTGLKKELWEKEKLKDDILVKIKEKIEKRKKQAQQQQKQQPSSATYTLDENNIELFPIPQSIRTLFGLLNITVPPNSKPIDYLNQIKQLPKNKELFQAFDSKKRATCNNKIKDVIDQIREGRSKFNEVIKIYEGRIGKLQEKLQKYKAERHAGDEKK